MISKSIGRLIASVLALPALAGCATGAVDNDMKFDTKNKTALVVLGWEGLDQYRGFSVGFNFRGINSAGAFDTRRFFISNGNGWQAKMSTEYYVVEVEPGAYIADYVNTDARGKVLARFCLGTLKFDTAAGKAVYIGNFYSPPHSAAIKLAPPHFDAATAKLAEFPQIKETLVTTKVRDVPYPSSDDCRGVRSSPQSIQKPPEKTVESIPPNVEKRGG